MSEGKKAQVATEYLILTAFILISVAIIFVFSFLNYSQNIRVAKASETLSKLANAVDDVYVSGEGNSRFVNLSLPDGMKELKIVHKCGYPPPNQGSLGECKDELGGSPATYDDVNFSAISITVQLLGGDSEIMRETRAKILEELGDMDDIDAQTGLNEYSGSAYSVRVNWTSDGQIRLEKV